MYQYPYGNAQQLNLDWVLGKLQELESGSTQVNIEEVANALVSASFDAGVSYSRYDYCFYNGKLYRALNDNTGAFNPADWLEVVIGDDIPVLTRLVNAVDASLTSLITTVNTHIEHIDWKTFNSNAAITSQIDALDDSGAYFGRIIYDAATGLPVATSGVVCAYCYGTNYKHIYFYPNGTADVGYVIAKIGGTWQNSWTLLPSTSTTVNGKALTSNITLNASDIPNDSNVSGTNVDNALNTLKTAVTPVEITSIVTEEENITLNAKNVYKVGRITLIYFNFNTATSLATNTNLFSGLPNAVATWSIIGDWVEQNQQSGFYVTSGGYMRNSGTLAAGHWNVIGAYITAN